MHSIRLRPLLANMAIPLGVGLISGAFTAGARDVYAALQQPALAPPGWLFPVVWTILYLLMGISAYRVWVNTCPERQRALWIYGVQLLLNAVWPVIFFHLGAYLAAFVWLLLLLAAVIIMIRRFARVDRMAARLQIPYLLWLMFAGYLNLAVWLLNR